MIASFNRRQALLAAGHFLLSLLALAATYGFFLFTANEVLELLRDLPFHFAPSTSLPHWIAIGCTDLRMLGTATHLLSQIFLAAPLQTLASIACLKSRLPEDPELEHSLSALLSRVEGTRKWHPTTVYTGHTTGLGYLVRMGKVLFSPSKGLASPL